MDTIGATYVLPTDRRSCGTTGFDPEALVEQMEGETPTNEVYGNGLSPPSSSVNLAGTIWPASNAF